MSGHQIGRSGIPGLPHRSNIHDPNRPPIARMVRPNEGREREAAGVSYYRVTPSTSSIAQEGRMAMWTISLGSGTASTKVDAGEEGKGCGEQMW